LLRGIFGSGRRERIAANERAEALKDYYAILGVVPSAEDIVIKAAYKALAQRYHPDRNPGSAEAAAKMAEINEAYSLLSDTVQRRTYDKSRAEKDRDFGDWIHEEEADQAANSFDPLKNDWTLAVGFYPDLADIINHLSKISKLLAFTYRASMLEFKAFEKRKELAQVLEQSFLETYFGRNPKIVDFARLLVQTGNKAAAKALNDAVRVLGGNAPSDRVISKICIDFNVETEEMMQRRAQEEAKVKWAAGQNAQGEKCWLAVSDEEKQFLNWCCWGDIKKVKESVNNKPKLVNITSNSCNTALHYAVITEQENIARFLVEKGASILVRNNEGKTPVGLAKSDSMRRILGHH